MNIDPFILAALVASFAAFGALFFLNLFSSGMPPRHSALGALLAWVVSFAAIALLANQEIPAPEYALLLTSAQVSPDVEKALAAAMRDGQVTWSEYRSISHVNGSVSVEEMRSIAKRVTEPSKK